MGKEFKKKFMHPTRRKLVDMVKTGEYDKNTQIGYEGKKVERKVGDVWEDDHYKYEKKQGYIVKQGKNSDVFEDIRKYLADLEKCKNKDCSHVGKFSSNNKKSIKEFGYCTNCMSELSIELKEAGILEDYAHYRVLTERIKVGLFKLEEIKQSMDGLKQQYDEIDENGQVVNSYVLPRPVDEMKEEMAGFIQRSREEIEIISDKRNTLFDRIKEKNYEHIL